MIPWKLNSLTFVRLSYKKYLGLDHSDVYLARIVFHKFKNYHFSQRLQRQHWWLGHAKIRFNVYSKRSRLRLIQRAASAPDDYWVSLADPTEECKCVHYQLWHPTKFLLKYLNKSFTSWPQYKNEKEFILKQQLNRSKPTRHSSSLPKIKSHIRRRRLWQAHASRSAAQCFCCTQINYHDKRCPFLNLAWPFSK